MRRILKRLDIRWVSMEYPEIVVSIWIVVMIAFTYPNLWELGDLRGGPTDDALYPGDPYREQHERVVSQPDFNAQELFTIVKILDNGVTAGALQDVLTLTLQLEQIPGFTVMGPAAMLEYADDGEGIKGVPYITEEEIKNFNAEQWKQRIKKNGSVHNFLVGKNFDWISVAVIPPTDDEHKTSWELASILENRAITGLERQFLKTDIYPADQSLLGIALGFVRWTIDRALNFDLIVFVSTGVCFSFFILWWYLGSFTQAALITVISIVSGIWITRGSIWLLHNIWTETHERVYTLLAYTNCIVQGGSLALHKMVAFREDKNISTKEKFTCSQLTIDIVIFSIACMAIGPFLLSMRTLGIWQMVELGIIASVGVGVVAFFLVVLVLPAAYLITERMRERITGRTESIQARTWNVEHSMFWLTKFQLHPTVSIAVVSLLFLHVSYLYITGVIVSKTRPLDYIKGTWAEKSAMELERMGAGNDTFNLFAWPRDPKTGERIPVVNTDFPITFADGLWHFQRALRPGGEFEQWQHDRYDFIYTMIGTGSLLDSVAIISQTSFRDEQGNFKPFPTTDMEISDAILITGDLADNIEHWIRGSQGIRITISVIIDDSVQFRELLERIDVYAKEKFPMLEVSRFGKITYFPRADQLITEGMGWNVISSLGMLVVCYILLVWWLHRGNFVYTLRPMACGFILVIPFLFSMGLNGERMWLWNIPLSMSSAPISELTINAANDLGMILVATYARYLKTGMNPRDAMNRALPISGAVILMDCFLNCIAFSPLWVSRFMPVREVAGTLQLMLIACTIGVIVLVPRLLILATKERKETAYAFQNTGIGANSDTLVPAAGIQ